MEDNFDYKKYLKNNPLLKENHESLEDFIMSNSQGNVKALKFKTVEDIETEIEKIRDEFNLVDSTSRYDEAYDKFEDIYNINPLLLINKIKEKQLNESHDIQNLEQQAKEFVSKYGKIKIKI